MPYYNQYKLPQQSNIPIGETFEMTTKTPLEANRIFDTYERADAYVKDVTSSAFPGILLSVISDPDQDKNGMYRVVASLTEFDVTYGMPVLYLRREGSVQSDWLESDTTSPAYIKHRPTCDYGTFTINSDGTVTEPPFAAGYMDYNP